MVRTQPTPRVENNTQRIASRYQACGQARIVGCYGFRADDHRVAQGTHPVQMGNILRPGDITGIARTGCDLSIQALAEMPEYDRMTGTRLAQWQIQPQELIGRCRQCSGWWHPALCKPPSEQFLGVIGRHRL